MKFTLTLVALAGFAAAAAAPDDTSSSSSNGAYPVSASSTSSAASTSAAPSGSSTSSPPASTSTYNPPAGISQQCSNFLTLLDKDDSIKECISPAFDALSGPSSSLDEFCTKAASGKCSDSAYYSWLSYFAANCTDELVSSPNDDVVEVFDSLYVVQPYSKVVCSKDQLNKYCVSASTAGNASYPDNKAQIPLSDSKGYPNPDAFAQANLLFLGYNSGMDSGALCTTCLKNIMGIYVNHEAKRPYPAGLSNSPLMKVQTDLWSTVQSSCPADFITSVVQNTGANPANVNGASSAFAPTKGLFAVLALIAGVSAI